MINELERVVLTTDVPRYHLAAGDIGTVVDISNDGEEYTIEFLTLDGETVAVVPVLRGTSGALAAVKVPMCGPLI